MHDVSRVRLASSRGPFEGALVVPSTPGWLSAVVVVGEEPTPDAHGLRIARRLAEAGHGALAIGQRPFDGDGRAYPDITLEAEAALAHLRHETGVAAPRYGILGYGPGGLTALVAGYRCQFGAAISFYGEGPMRLRAELGRLIESPKPQAAAFLFLVGANDDAVRAADLAAIHTRLQTFGMKHTMIVYPRRTAGFARLGDAAFADVEDRDAWQRVLHVLETSPRLRNRVPPYLRRR
jgi:dienelactone hydrolase